MLTQHVKIIIKCGHLINVHPSILKSELNRLAGFPLAHDWGVVTLTPLENRMSLKSLSSVITRISLLALVLFARPLSSYSQSSELEAVFFDEDLQPVTLKPTVKMTSNLDVLHEETNLHWYSMFSELPNDWANSASIVFRKESIPALASLGVLTFALMRVDNETWRSTHGFVRLSETVHKLSNYTVALGDGKLHLGIAGIFAA